LAQWNEGKVSGSLWKQKKEKNQSRMTLTVVIGKCKYSAITQTHYSDSFLLE